MRALALMLAASIGPCVCGDQEPGPLGVRQVDELGALPAPAIVLGRDGGASGRVGEKALWVFGDTLLSAAAADGKRFRSSTAAWAALPDPPIALDEALDAAGAPFDLLPFTNDEAAQSTDPEERWALWPGSVVAAPEAGSSGSTSQPAHEAGALVFYTKLRVHPGFLNFEAFGTGLARLAAGSTVAVRDAQMLFRAPEPSFNVGAVVSEGDVYLYGCDSDGTLAIPCRVARAPLPRAGERAAWQVWDGAAWTSDIARAAPVLHGAPGDLSVSWNDFVGAFIAVHSEVFSDRVVLRTAPRPEGPWSEPLLLFTGLQAMEGRTNYAGKEHPELAVLAGKRIFVSYARPTGTFTGELRLTAVTLGR